MFGLSLLQLKLIGAGLLLAALTTGVLIYGAKREAAGRAEGQRVQLETDKQQFEQVQKQYQAVLVSNEKTIEAANTRIAGLETQIQSLSAQFSVLASQRQQQVTQVGKLPDSEVKSDIELKLGGPLENLAILRKADLIVTDYPLVVKQVDILSEKVDKLGESIKETNVKIDALTKQRDAAIAFGDTVTGYYTKAYNASQVKHSLFLRIISFGLVKNRHMDLPNPTTLRSNVP